MAYFPTTDVLEYRSTLDHSRRTFLGRVKRYMVEAIILFGLLCLSSLAQGQITIAHMGTYATGSYDAGAAEIAEFDPVNDRIWFTNAQANSIIGLNASNPASPSLFLTIPMVSYGGGVNSVVVLSNGFAVAVEASPKTNPGKVVFFDLNGVFISQVTVGDRKSVV